MQTPIDELPPFAPQILQAHPQITIIQARRWPPIHTQIHPSQSADPPLAFCFMAQSTARRRAPAPKSL
jgi:hypothetical protein